MRYFILSFLVCSVGCSQRLPSNEIDRVRHLRHLVGRIGVVRLPFTYDLVASRIDSKYSIDQTSMDTLFFSGGPIQGVLPDTTEFYCFLHYQIGDLLRPFLTTIDKDGNIIDTQDIGIGNCGGLAAVKVDRCIDEVTILPDMSLELLYEMNGTMESDSNHQQVKICDKIVGKGRVDKNGKIEIMKSKWQDCN